MTLTMRMTPKTMVLPLLAMLGALVIPALAPSAAEAQQRRPLYAGFGIGPHAFWAGDDRGWGWGRGCCDAHFRAQGEFGWHPSGDDSGFFLAGEAIVTFGPHYFMFMPGVRLGGDIQVYDRRDVTVFLRPSGLVGGGLWDLDGDGNSWGFFALQPAFDVRVAVADHLIQIWARPIGLDLLFFPDWWDDRFHFSVGYTFQVGLDFAF